MARAGLTIVVAVAGALGLLACGGDDEPAGAGGSSTAATSAGDGPAKEVTESVDKPARLPERWQKEINPTAGFSIGVPPDWTYRETQGGQGGLLRSPDELITLSVTADRTQGALELPLDEFATRTAEALGSEVVGAHRIGGLKVREAAPFKDAYDAVGVRARGRSQRTGVREGIFVVVARRPGQAAYVFVARENAKERSKIADRDTVDRVIRSLRGRPPA